MFALRKATRLAPRQAASRAPAHLVRLYSENGSTSTNGGNGNGNDSGNGNGADSKEPDTPASSEATKPALKKISNSTPKPSSQPLSQQAKTSKSDVINPAAPKNAGGLPIYAAKTIVTSDPAKRATRADFDIDWENSYHGISTRPVTQAQFQVLMRPIPETDIEVKPDGVIYLPEIKYRRRLNEAFGPMGWGLIPRSEPVIGSGIVTREYALIVDGRFVSQAQGENQYFSPEGMPSAVEGCKSNALMRTCKDLGIASELWDPVFVRAFKKKCMQEVWVEHATTKKKRTLWFRRDKADVVYPWKKV